MRYIISLPVKKLSTWIWFAMNPKRALSVACVLSLIFLSSESLYAFHISSQTELLGYYTKSIRRGNQTPLALFLSLNLSDLTQRDAVNSFVETNLDPSDTPGTHLFIYEMSYRSTTFWNQVATSVGRQQIGYGFHPVMSDAFLVDWKGIDHLQATAYAGNAYFENQQNISALPWSPMAGFQVQAEPLWQWRISPAFRAINFDHLFHEYLALQITKAWDIPLSLIPEGKVYSWYTGSQKAQLVTDMQAEYEWNSHHLTTLLAQMSYTPPSRISVTLGAKYSQQPLLFKLSDQQHSVFEIFGLKEITETFISTTAPLWNTGTWEVSASYHQYPNQNNQSQTGYLIQALIDLQASERTQFGPQSRYYNSFGGWLIGGGVFIIHLISPRVKCEFDFDVDRYKKVNGVSAIAYTLRPQLGWNLDDHLTAKLITDIESNHLYSVNFKAIGSLVYATY